MKHYILTTLACWAICAATIAQEDWKLTKSGHGVQVFTRKTDESPIKEYLAEVVVNAPLDEVVAFFNRIELHPEWMAGISSAGPLVQGEETLQYVIDAPFPMQDRYVLLEPKGDDSNMPAKYWIAMENVDKHLDDTDLIPLARLKGGWSFIKIDDNTTKVTQQFVSDPGGAMPDWVVNMFIVKNPYKSLRALKEIYED